MIHDMNRYTKGVRERQAELDAKQVAEAINEPTLTCSEVVERLAKCAGIEYEGILGSDMVPVSRASFDRTKAEAILHSWRERRVQELEERLAKRSGCSHGTDSGSRSTSANDPKEIRMDEKTWCDVPNCGRRPRLCAFDAPSPELTEPDWPKETQRMIDSAAQWSEEQSKEVCVCGDIRRHHAFGSAFATRNPGCNKFQKREG